MAKATKAKQAQNSYTGELAEPIKIDQPLVGILGDVEEAKARYTRDVNEARARKLLQLFKHYGLNPQSEEDTLSLVFRLAIARVPGFAVAKRAGRKRKPPNDFDIYARVRFKMLAKSLSANRASDLVAKDMGSPDKGPTLRRKYTDHVAKWGQLVQKAAKQRGISEADLLKEYLENPSGN